MFGRVHNTCTTCRQEIDDTCTTCRQEIDDIDIDEVIESKIIACQQENGECMKSTSRKLRKQYGDEHVTRILRRLTTRRYRANKYPTKAIMNIVGNLTKRSNGLTTQSSSMDSL